MKPHVQDRPKVKTPEEVVTRLAYVIRDQLYRDEQRGQFYGQLQDLRRVITWPAAWFNERALFVSLDRYQEIMLGIIKDVKRHGNTGSVGYWPRYLLTAVQSHFRFNAQDYNDEGKAARDSVARVLSHLPKPASVPAPDEAIRTMAAAHLIVRSPGGRKKAANVRPVAIQSDLFGHA